MDFKVIVCDFSQISTRTFEPGASAWLSALAAAAGAHQGRTRTMCLIPVGAPRHNSEGSAENTRLLYF